MRDKFEKFLIDNEYLPLTSSNWNTINVQHDKSKDKKTHKKVRAYIKSQIGNEKLGIYVYENKDGEILYVGEGNLIQRIHDHYSKAVTEFKKDYKEHYDFFGYHQGEITIYWTEVENKNISLVIEGMLTEVLQPLFKSFSIKE